MFASATTHMAQSPRMTANEWANPPAAAHGTSNRASFPCIRRCRRLVFINGQMCETCANLRCKGVGCPNKRSTQSDWCDECTDQLLHTVMQGYTKCPSPKCFQLIPPNQMRCSQCNAAKKHTQEMRIRCETCRTLVIIQPERVNRCSRCGADPTVPPGRAATGPQQPQSRAGGTSHYRQGSGDGGPENGRHRRRKGSTEFQPPNSPPRGPGPPGGPPGPSGGPPNGPGRPFGGPPDDSGDDDEDDHSAEDSSDSEGPHAGRRTGGKGKSKPGLA